MRILLGYPFLQYIGQPYTQPIKLRGIAGISVPLLLPWLIYGAATSKPNVGVNVDLSTQNVAKALQQIRSIYIDNMGSDTPMYVSFPDTGYQIVCKPNSAGWFPVYTNQFKFSISGLGFFTGDIPTTLVLVTNLDVPPAVDIELDQHINLWKASNTITRGNTIYNTNFGAPALGDQTGQGSFTLLGANTSPAFNSPYTSGFIYLTQLTIVAVQCSNTVPIQGVIVLESTGISGVLYQIVFGVNAATIAASIPNDILLQQGGKNIKLDATQTWRFRNLVNIAAGSIFFSYDYTVNPF
jgi:hypothetical protein